MEQAVMKQTEVSLLTLFNIEFENLDDTLVGLIVVS